VIGTWYSKRQLTENTGANIRLKDFNNTGRARKGSVYKLQGIQRLYSSKAQTNLGFLPDYWSHYLNFQACAKL